MPLPKILSHTFEANIWSIGYWGTPKAPFLWIETKDQTSHAWFGMDLSELGQKPFEIPCPAQKNLVWLCGIEGIGVFLRLQSGKNPGIEAVEAYQLATGEKQYEVEVKQRHQLVNEFLLINQDSTSLHWLNLRNGFYVDAPTSSRYEAFEIDASQHFEESQPGFKEFQQFFELQFSEKIVKGLDYWEGADKLIFSYYLYESDLKNKLRVTDKAFNILHEDVLAEGDGMGYQTFQVFQNQLIYIKNKYQLDRYVC